MNARAGVVSPVLLSVILLMAPGPLPGVVRCEAQTTSAGRTLTLDEDAPRPLASMADVEWLTGRWVGEGLGAFVEEVWLPPRGGAMAGVFRLVRADVVELYEMVTLVEEEGSLVLRLKHFDADLTGWEAPDESVSFPLVRRDDEVLWFDGLTIRRVGSDQMEIWVSIQSGGAGPRDVLFEYRRAGSE